MWWSTGAATPTQTCDQRSQHSKDQIQKPEAGGQKWRHRQKGKEKAFLSSVITRNSSPVLTLYWSETTPLYHLYPLRTSHLVLSSSGRLQVSVVVSVCVVFIYQPLLCASTHCKAFTVWRHQQPVDHKPRVSARRSPLTQHTGVIAMGKLLAKWLWSHCSSSLFASPLILLHFGVILSSV